METGAAADGGAVYHKPQSCAPLGMYPGTMPLRSITPLTADSLILYTVAMQ